MNIFCRISPHKEMGRPFANGDKLRLVTICLTSLLRASSSYNKYFFLLDGCPAIYEREIHGIILRNSNAAMYNIMKLDGIGNKPSFLRQLDMALELPDKATVYFAEDDYLYRKVGLLYLCDAMGPLDETQSFFTLYDHPDRYTHDDDRETCAEIRVAGGCHWRTVESTCMSFAAQVGLLRRVEPIIREHACAGREMWYPILDMGYKLWGPIPGLATHVQDGYLAPCVDWEEIWQSLQ